MCVYLKQRYRRAHVENFVLQAAKVDTGDSGYIKAERSKHNQARASRIGKENTVVRQIRLSLMKANGKWTGSRPVERQC